MTRRQMADPACGHRARGRLLRADFSGPPHERDRAVSNRLKEAQVAPFTMALADEDAAIAQVNQALASAGLSSQILRWNTEPLPRSFHRLISGSGGLEYLSRLQPDGTVSEFPARLTISSTHPSVEESGKIGPVLEDFCQRYHCNPRTARRRSLPRGRDGYVRADHPADLPALYRRVHEPGSSRRSFLSAHAARPRG